MKQSRSTVNVVRKGTPCALCDAQGTIARFGKVVKCVRCGAIQGGIKDGENK